MNLLKKYPLIKHLLLMLCVFVTLVLFAFLLLRICTKHGKEYALPDILNKNISEVQEMDEMSRFELVLIDSVYVNNKPGGIIIAMDPPPQSMIKEDRKIYVTITSNDPEDVEVPNLVDLTVRQAVSLLESHGLTCGTLSFTPDIGRNAVLDQLYEGKSISPKTKIPRYSSINLLVGSGIDSTSSLATTIPLIIGKTPQEARRALKVASLNVGKEHFEKGATEDNARVKKQSPGYYGKPSARLGASVEIWYVHEDKENFDKVIKDYVAEIAADSLSDEENEAEDEVDNW